MKKTIACLCLALAPLAHADQDSHDQAVRNMLQADGFTDAVKSSYHQNMVKHNSFDAHNMCVYQQLDNPTLLDPIIATLRDSVSEADASLITNLYTSGVAKTATEESLPPEAKAALARVSGALSSHSTEMRNGMLQQLKVLVTRNCS